MNSVAMKFQFLIKLKGDNVNSGENGLKHLITENNLVIPRTVKISVTEKTNFSVEFGSFYFTVEDKLIPIKFDNYSVHCKVIDDKTVLITYISGEGLPASEKLLSDVYDYEYSALNISRKNLTAKALSESYDIDNFYFTVSIDNDELFTQEYDIELKSIVFIDEDKEYPMKQKIIDYYNNH